MKKTLLAAIMVSTVLAALVSGTLFVKNVKATPKTIIVPDDYPTIASAIGNATNGDIILVRKGTYLERSLTINKTLTLIGENAENTIIRNLDVPHPFLTSPLWAGPNTITISADNVTITGFTIETNNTGADPYLFGVDVAKGGFGTFITGNNLADGITLSAGSYQSVIQNNIGKVNFDGPVIFVEAPYTLVANNTITGRITVQTGAGVGARNSVIYGNAITDVMSDLTFFNWGIKVYMSNDNLIAKNSITNSRGAIVMDIASYNTISANTIINSYVGLGAIQGGGKNTFYANNVKNNTYATSITGLNNTLFDNNFVNNTQQAGYEVLGMGPNPAAETIWHNGTEGNHWSNYTGVDADLDGKGDTPYIIDANQTDPYPLISAFNVSSVTIKMPDWATALLSYSVVAPSFPPQPKPSPTPTPTPTPSPSPSATKTPLPSLTTTPSYTPTTSPNPTPTLSPSPSPNASPSTLPSPSDSPQLIGDPALPLPVILLLSTITVTTIAIVTVVVITKKKRK